MFDVDIWLWGDFSLHHKTLHEVDLKMVRNFSHFFLIFFLSIFSDSIKVYHFKDLRCDQVFNLFDSCFRLPNSQISFSAYDWICFPLSFSIYLYSSFFSVGQFLEYIRRAYVAVERNPYFNHYFIIILCSGSDTRTSEFVNAPSVRFRDWDGRLNSLVRKNILGMISNWWEKIDFKNTHWNTAKLAWGWRANGEK